MDEERLILEVGKLTSTLPQTQSKLVVVVGIITESCVIVQATQFAQWNIDKNIGRSGAAVQQGSQP